MNKRQYDYWKGWMERQPMFGKPVTCIRCFSSYKLGEVQETLDSPGCYWKESKCPNCGCKLYWSNL